MIASLRNGNGEAYAHGRPGTNLLIHPAKIVQKKSKLWQINFEIMYASRLACGIYTVLRSMYAVRE